MHVNVIQKHTPMYTYIQKNIHPNTYIYINIQTYTLSPSTDMFLV